MTAVMGHDETMANWQIEIEELHDIFEAYFLGKLDSLERVEAALAATFTIVGPHGIESTRADTMLALRAGHGHTSSLRITISDPVLLLETPDIVMARYIENHQLADRTNHRLSTVVFTRSESAPNGLQWCRVHETWLH